jgi:hypothetical protein
MNEIGTEWDLMLKAMESEKSKPNGFRGDLDDIGCTEKERDRERHRNRDPERE